MEYRVRKPPKLNITVIFYFRKIDWRVRSSQPTMKQSCWFVAFRISALVVANTMHYKQFYVGSYDYLEVRNPNENAKNPNIELHIALMKDLTYCWAAGLTLLALSVAPNALVIRLPIHYLISYLLYLKSSAIL